MARWSSADSGQRLKLCLTKLIMRRAEEGGWGRWERPQFEDPWDWINGRKKSLGARKGKIVHVVPYQDDLFVFVLEDAAAEDTEK